MKKIEILAPAGSKESFIAAVEAGADAVYCGLNSFSARARAGNFTPAELYSHINYARSKNVKVYAAFNTLIKQTEIKEAVKQLNFLAQSGADAVIVQDMGAANIIRNHFPSLKLHASTQSAIHNSYGVLQAKEAGFKRAVLARELSLAEIKDIASKSDIELEVFVHGALCFCVSGMCLMSSFIGGHSGNRGSCAQPCRRKWSFRNKNGFYLSPKDLELISYVRELKNAGAVSLKIEGRMKNPQYVYKTVKAYKMIAAADVDGYENILAQARDILSQDFARAKTSFNIAGNREDIFDPDAAKQTGVSLGKILEAKGGTFTIKKTFRVNAGDSLKAADLLRDEYHKIKILKIKENEAGTLYEIETDCGCLKSAMEIFKTSDAEFAAFLNGITADAKAKIENRKFEVKQKEIPFPFFKTPGAKEELFVRIDNEAWIKELPPGINIIFSLNVKNTLAAAKLKRVKFFELPPYIEEKDLPLFQKTADELSQTRGVSFFVNNLSHFQFFKKTASLFAGHFLYCLNSFAADFMFKKGVKGFVFSWEDDINNIEELSKNGLGERGIFYLSGMPVLAVSKMRTHKDIYDRDTLKSAKDSFKIILRNGEALLLPEYPVMLFDKMQRMKKHKIKKFAIDLSFIAPDRNYITALSDAYKGKRPLQNGIEFNFERGLK